MHIALLQLNPTVGDLEGNAARLAAMSRQAAAQGARLCLAPELAIHGYPPRDLLLYEDFLDRSMTVLGRLARELADGPPLLVGAALPRPSCCSDGGKSLYNGAVLLQNGSIVHSFHKCLLPTYDVFDEARYFEPGHTPGSFELDGLRIGVTICEDLWNDIDFWQRRQYATDPVAILKAQGVDCIVNLSGSPFTAGKQATREAMLAMVAKKYRLPIYYVNQAGGNDDLLFDGRSMVFDAKGRCTARARAFEEEVLLVDTDKGGPRTHEDPAPEEEIRLALLCGIRDYLAKTGFSRVVLGLSGGIDSALTAVLAAQAIGPEQVLAVCLPSPYSSQGSLDDSYELCRRAGIPCITLPIADLMQAYERALAEPFAGLPQDVTEENMQSRIRGGLLMAISNKQGRLLLTTGNKSELSVGYATIYGDMCGGLAVIADLPKMTVYALARHVNARFGEPIPVEIIDKAPSAELRPDQKDQDSLPPYEVLDAILKAYVEDRQSPSAIVAQGFDAETVDKVVRLVQRAEFKRRQAAPGLKITDRAFGQGWRMPLAGRWL
ncbi:NAD+ synthase [Megalodesulfovibrio gigas]|uniref:Glutamine-dependent NAD(+) synthetase n=1 Tax=Megalodesulfovibrio gigas (strain ATCC 19364 / DSM 1382 / NCIMB 9332 / VKM B-1759) TaxID=1121448 RepID=T2G7I1_MEGG1|nr:NAD+ synthase [Megalodesulfovibrio gigas]AGW12243.1 putative NH(3)-dependent NAD(+) synthetase [Megalodesulfovibrio gigas DSM 1382 = ATCC 19364]